MLNFRGVQSNKPKPTPHTPGTNKISHLERFLEKKMLPSNWLHHGKPHPLICFKKRTSWHKNRNQQPRFKRSNSAFKDPSKESSTPKVRTSRRKSYRFGVTSKGGDKKNPKKNGKNPPWPVSLFKFSSKKKEMNWRWCFFLLEEKNREEKVPFWNNFCFEIS